VLVIVAATVLGSTSGTALSDDGSLNSPTGQRTQATLLKGEFPKLSGDLYSLYLDHSLAPQQGDKDVGVADPIATITIEILLHHYGVTVSRAFRNSGGVIAYESPDAIIANVPVLALGDLSNLIGVSRLSKPIPPWPQVVSQGATVHDAIRWHTGGVSGASVKLGVIDVGFEGYPSLVGNELPAPSGVMCFIDQLGNYSDSLADCENGVVQG
jgi:hypothetical protein